ncbi:MAG: hypothetical protein J2P36_16620 [Ktedonobacteraceae bacterium]|nr:hypothetical protein [Ktedonobacteraceae bacterium]
MAAAQCYQGSLPEGLPVVAIASGSNTTLEALWSLAATQHELGAAQGVRGTQEVLDTTAIL